MRFVHVRLLSILAVIVITAFPAYSQFSGPATGTPAFGSFTGGPDVINLGNLNVHIAIPIFSKPGRGIPYQYSLVYDSSVWNAQGSWQPPTGSVWGWQAGVTQLLGGYLQGVITLSKCGSAGSTKYIYSIANIAYKSPDGLSHSFAGAGATLNQCTNAQTSAQGSSGDGYYINAQISAGPDSDGVADAVITTPSGDMLSTSLEGVGKVTGAFNQGVTDTNGNHLGPSTGGDGNPTDPVYDTMGMQPLNITWSAEYYGQQYLPTAFTYTDANGNPQTITVNYGSFTIQTNFGDGSIAEYSAVTQNLPTSIGFPDGTSYQFGYEPTPGNPGHVTGRIASLTLRTGGTISYQYVDGYSGIEADGTTAGIIRTTSDGATRFDRSNVVLGTSGSGGSSTTTVTDALNNQTAADFVETNYNFYETRSRIFSGSVSGNPLRSISTCYNGVTSNCVTSALTLPITQRYVATTLETGLTSAVSTKYNSTGTIAEADVYDFGGSSPTSKAVTSYATLGNNILDRPSSTVLSDTSGNTISQSTFAYDESVSCSGTSNVTGTRGNRTSAHQTISSSSGTLNSTFCNDQAGQIVGTVDPAGNATKLGYDATYDAFLSNLTPPTPSSGVSLPVSAITDANTGLVTSTLDPNSTKTTYTYDSALRPHEIDKFDSSGSMVGKTIYTYYSSQDTGVSNYQSASTNANVRTLVDGYGRTSRIAVFNGQGSDQWYQQDVCYDSLGRVSFRSYRYQGTGWGTAKVCSGNGDSYSYDALGRVKSITHGDGTNIQYSYTGRATQVTDENGVSSITQVDGLGRTTAVCEISSNSSMPGSGSPTNCGMDISGTGFLTSYVYDLGNHKTTVTQGAQTRVFQTDWLGRTILTQEPERGQTTYSYAYNSTGLQVKRQRPKANQTSPSVLTTTTTQYDALGRVLTVNYDDGATPNKQFVYDANTYWQQTATNLKGRLAVIGAVLGGGGEHTGALFSYNAIGRVIGLWQCTPSTCGTSSQASRSMTYSYDWLGNVTSAGDGSGVTTSYNNYSPANEVASVTSSLSDATHPGTLVSNIVYGPNGPFSYQLGNGLTTVLTYDSMGRRSGGWVCNGSSQPGCTNGTQLYGFNVNWSGVRNTSICDTSLNRCENFGYDEFNRLTSQTTTSGATLNLSWVYDRYGNRWQENPNGAQILFNTNNNQVNTSGYAYDAAGNLIADGINTYSYDAEGNIAQVNYLGGAINKFTYDALNHQVQYNYIDGSTTITNEFVLNLSGLLGSIWQVSSGSSSETYGKAYWGMLPIESYVVGANKAYFQHFDWELTKRLTTDNTGAVYGVHTSLPFGDGFANTFGSRDNTFDDFDLMWDWAATSHAQFRDYSKAQGRWIQPDPYDGSYDFANPQSLNRYSYVLNNPLSFTDPLGLDFMTDSEVGDFGGPDQQSTCSLTNPCPTNSYLLWPPPGLNPPPSAPSVAQGGGYGNSGLGVGGASQSWRPSFGNPMANALFSPQVGGRYFGEADDAVNAAGIATGIVYGGLFAAMGAPAALSTAGQYAANATGLLGPVTNRVFWSTIGSTAAASRAAESGGTTLEMTPLGSFANWAQSFLPQTPTTGAVWDWLSAGFAKGAQGPVTYLQGARLGFTWLYVELPILVQQGNPITTIPMVP